MSKRIAILVAMEREITPLLRKKEWVRRAWPVHECAARQAWLVHESVNGETVVVVAGIGRKAVAAATRAVVDNFDPEYLISAGLAGALTAAHSPGEVLRPAIVIDANTGEKYETLRDVKARGVLVTAASVLSREDKQRFAKQFGADAVDMEAAVVAEIARASGVPFIAVKAISDPLELEMLPMDRFIDSAGELNLLKLIGYAALRPRRWRVLNELRRNSRVAAEALVKELELITV